MSNQPPYDGSQDPLHEQPTQGVPHVEDQGQGTDSRDAQGGGSTDWSAPPSASPYGAPSGSSYGESTPQYGSPPQYGQSAPQYGSPPQYGQSAPYGQTGKDPYGAPEGGYDAYGQQGKYGGYPQQGYYSPAPPQGNGSNTSAIVLTVTSGLAIFFCCGAGLPSLIMGIIALTKQAADPAGAARLAKIGWIVFGVLVALAVIGIVLLFALGTFAGGSGGSDPSSYGGNPSYSSTF